MDTLGEIIDLDIAAEVELDENGCEILSTSNLNKTKSNILSCNVNNNETKIPLRRKLMSIITIKPGSTVKRLKRILPTKPTRPAMLGNLSFREIAGKRKNMSKISKTKTDHNNGINLENNGKIKNKDNSPANDTRKLIGKTVKYTTQSSQDYSIKFLDEIPPDLLKKNQKMYRIKPDVLFNTGCILNGLSEEQTHPQKPKENSLKFNDNCGLETWKLQKQSEEFPNADNKVKYLTKNGYLNHDSGTNKLLQNYNFGGISRNRDAEVDNNYSMNINNYTEETDHIFQNMGKKEYNVTNQPFLLASDVREPYSDLNGSIVHLRNDNDLSVLSEVASKSSPLPITNPCSLSADVIKESVKTFREIGVNTELCVTDFLESGDEHRDRSTEKHEKLNQRSCSVKTTVNSKKQNDTSLEEMYKTKAFSGSHERKFKNITPWCLQYTSSLPDIHKAGNYRKENTKNNNLLRNSNKILHNDYCRREKEKKILFHRPPFANNSISKNDHHRNALVPHKEKTNSGKHSQPLNHSNVKTKSSIEVINHDHGTSSLEENLSLDTEYDDEISIIKEIYLSSSRTVNSLSRPKCAFVQNKYNGDSRGDVNKPKIIKITKVPTKKINLHDNIKKVANKSLIQTKGNSFIDTTHTKPITENNSKSNRVCNEDINISKMTQLQSKKNDLLLDTQEKENNKMSLPSIEEKLLNSINIKKCSVELERLDLSHNKYIKIGSTRGIIEVTNTVVSDNSFLLDDGTVMKHNSSNVEPLHVSNTFSKPNVATIKQFKKGNIVENIDCKFDCTVPECKITNTEGNNINKSPVSNRRLNVKATEKEINYSLKKGKRTDIKISPNMNFQNVKRASEEYKPVNHLPLNRETQPSNLNSIQRKSTVEENMKTSDQSKTINSSSTGSNIALVKAQHNNIDKSGFWHDDTRAEGNGNMENSELPYKNNTLSKSKLKVKVVLEKLKVVENRPQEQETSVTEDINTTIINVQSSQRESVRASYSDVNFSPTLKKVRGRPKKIIFKKGRGRPKKIFFKKGSGRPKKINPSNIVQKMEFSNLKHKSPQSLEGKNSNINIKKKTSIKDNLAMKESLQIDKKSINISSMKTHNPENDQSLPCEYDIVEKYYCSTDNIESFDINNILSKTNPIKNNTLPKDNIVENHLTIREEESTITENSNTNLTKVISKKRENERLTENSVDLCPAIKKGRGRPKKISLNKTSQTMEGPEDKIYNSVKSPTENAEGKNLTTNAKLESSIKNNLNVKKTHKNKIISKKSNKISSMKIHYPENDQSLPYDYITVGECVSNIENIESFDINNIVSKSNLMKNNIVPENNIGENHLTITEEERTIMDNNNTNITKIKSKEIKTEKLIAKHIICPTMKKKRGRPRNVHLNNKIEKIENSIDHKQTSLITHNQETQGNILNYIESKTSITECLSKKTKQNKARSNCKKISKSNSIKKKMKSINDLSGSCLRTQVLQSDNGNNKKKMLKINKGTRFIVCPKYIQKYNSPTISAEDVREEMKTIFNEPCINVEQLNYVNNIESKLKCSIQSAVSNKVDDSINSQVTNLKFKKVDVGENYRKSRKIISQRQKLVEKIPKGLKCPIKAFNGKLFSEAPNKYKTRMCTTQQLRKLRSRISSSPLKDTSLKKSPIKKSTNSLFDLKHQKEKFHSNVKTKFIGLKSKKKTKAEVKTTLGKTTTRKDFSINENITSNDQNSLYQNTSDKLVKNIFNEPFVNVEQLNYVNNIESKLKCSIQSAANNKVDDSISSQVTNLKFKKVDVGENYRKTRKIISQRQKLVKKSPKGLKCTIKAFNGKLVSEAPSKYKTRMCTTQQLRKLRSRISSSPLKNTSLKKSPIKKSTNSSFDLKHQNAKQKVKLHSNEKTKFIRLKSKKKTKAEVKTRLGKTTTRKDFSTNENITSNDQNSLYQNTRDKLVKNMNSDNTDKTKVNNSSETCDKRYLDSISLSQYKEYENVHSEQYLYSDSHTIINTSLKETAENENQNNVVQPENLTYSNFDVLNEEVCSTPVINKTFNHSDSVINSGSKSFTDGVSQVKDINCESAISSDFFSSSMKQKANIKPTGLTKSLSELSDNSNQIPTAKGKMREISFSRYKHNKLTQSIPLHNDSQGKHISGVYNSISKSSENEYFISTDTVQSYEASHDSLLKQLNSPGSSELEESRINHSDRDEAKSSNTTSRVMTQEECVETFHSCQPSLQTDFVPTNLFEDDNSTTISITNVQSLCGTEDMSIFDQLNCSDTTETVPEFTVTDEPPVISKKLQKIINQLAKVQRNHSITIKSKS